MQSQVVIPRPASCQVYSAGLSAGSQMLSSCNTQGSIGGSYGYGDNKRYTLALNPMVGVTMKSQKKSQVGPTN